MKVSLTTWEKQEFASPQGFGPEYSRYLSRDWPVSAAEKVLAADICSF